MKPLTSRPFDLVVVIFFLSHIPVTVFLDSQVVLPASWYPQFAKDGWQLYIHSYNDPLVKSMPVWFKMLICIEIFIQLPFFFVGAYAFALGKRWIKVPAVIYGIFVASGTFLMLGEFAMSPEEDVSRGLLVAFYFPYFILPLAIALRMLLVDDPFATRRKKTQ